MADTKDRHSRMANSSVNQPMKKGGGGTANWGNAAAEMYDPVGHQHATVALAPIITVAPAQYVPYQPMAHNISDANAFPSLGGTAAPVVSRAPAAAWGAGMQVVQSAAPMFTVAYPELQEQNRQGVVFDSSHPRNQFAKRPVHASGQTVGVVGASPPTTIDWSQAGTQTIAQAALHLAAYPGAHGPNAGVSSYPSIPLEQLRAQPVYQQVPQHVQQVVQNPVYQKVTQGRGQ